MMIRVKYRWRQSGLGGHDCRWIDEGISVQVALTLSAESMIASAPRYRAVATSLTSENGRHPQTFRGLSRPAPSAAGRKMGKGDETDQEMETKEEVSQLHHFENTSTKHMARKEERKGSHRRVLGPGKRSSTPASVWRQQRDSHFFCTCQ